jgi:hypothetical protein
VRSGLYDGEVVHQRHSPRRHRLRYRLFQLLLDLDELPALDRGLTLFGHNRAAVFSFHDRDHLAGEARPLRGQVQALLTQAGIDVGGGPIRLLSMPRVLGYVFNPLSIFYCHRPDGELAAAVLEVNNTFGERHVYVVEAGLDGRIVRRGCGKAFFVSPFLGLDMTYDFRLAAPGETAATAILARGADGAPVVAAAFAGRRRPLTDRTLARAFLAHPLLTLKVVAAIHWEAAKLLAKGVPLRRKPAPPPSSVTVVRSEADAPAGDEAEPRRRAGDVAFLRGGGGLEPQQAERAQAAVGEEPQVQLAARRGQSDPPRAEAQRREVGRGDVGERRRRCAVLEPQRLAEFEAEV